jgi:hypothetical protein
MKFIKFLGLFAFIFNSYVYGQVSVYAKVDHIVPDGIDTQGGISLTVSGSTSPYTYTWNPGAISTKDINNINAGQYTVNVRSASSQTYTNRYSLGYKVDWTNLYKCYFRNDSLVSTANNYCRAVSKNTLPANTDGWFEYIISEMPIKFAFLGLTDSISPNVSNISDINYGFRFHSSFQTVHYLESGASTTLYSTPKIGDVFRVERIGNTINYRVNGIVVRTITNASIGGKIYKLKASLTNAARVLNLGCSFLPAGNITFPNYVNVQPLIKHTSTGGFNGSINLTPELPGSYNYTWQPSGTTSSSYTGLNIGNYRVDIKNSDNIISKKYYNIGYKVNWINLNRCYFRNDSLVSTSTAVSKAVSKNTLVPNTDGWFEFVLDELPFEMGNIGFTDSISPNVDDITDIDYGFRLHKGQKYIYYYESGSAPTPIELSPKIGDIYRIERVGNTINYKLNGVVLRTVTQAGLSAKTLKLKANLYNGFKLVNLGCSFNQSGNGYFANYINVYPIIKHVTSVGANNGSINAINQFSVSYTYTWQPSGSNINPTAGLNIGPHKLNIKDSDNNISSEWFNVGYKVNWTNLNICYFRNDSLVSTSSSSTGYGQAVSKNTLLAGQNGWIEFVLTSVPAANAYVGFLDSISPNLNIFSDIDYGIYLSNNGSVGSYESGVTTWLSTAPSIGDVIRLERVGNSIIYSINGIVRKTTTVAGISSKILKVKAPLASAARLVNLGCSFIETNNVVFPNYVEVIPVIKHNTSIGFNDGSISVKARATGLQTYSWQPNGFTSNPNSPITVGSYSVLVTDSLGNQSRWKYNVGYKTKWTNISGAGNWYRNDSLYARDATSKNILPANTDGWFEYVFNRNQANDDIIGFADTSGSTPVIQYGLRYYAVGKYFQYYESGTQSGLATYVRIGDVVRVERIGNTITYRVNGTLIRTVTNPAIGLKTFKLRAIMGFQNLITNFGCSFPSCIMTPPIITANLSPACIGSGLILSSPLVGGLSYQWYNGINPIVGETANSINPTVSGSYYLKVTNSTGCVANSNIFSVLESPVVNVTSSKTTICSGTPVVLTANVSSGTGFIYQWLNGGSNVGTNSSSYSTSIVGTYQVVVNGNNGCSTTSSPITLNISSLSVNAGNDKLLTTAGLVNLTPTVTGGAPTLIYSWTPTNLFASPSDAATLNPSVTLSTTQTFNLSVTDADGCTANDYVTVLFLNEVNSYGVLKKNQDGGFYQVTNNKVYFKFEEEYMGMVLNYKLYNYTNAAVNTPINLITTCSDLNVINTTLGDNRYFIDLTNCGSLTSNNYYLLEVINSKNEKFYLKFKI